MDLPNGWSRLTDEHGRTYYHDTATGKTSWNPPPPSRRQPPPPPPPPPEAPTVSPLTHADSYSSSGFHAYPSAYPSSTPDYAAYSYPQYPSQYSYHQPQSGASHPSLPHSSYQPPSSAPLGSYPSGPPGAPPSHAPPRPPGSHAAPSSLPPPGAPSSHTPPPHIPPSHAPPPGSHAPPYTSYPMPTHSYPHAYQHQDPTGAPQAGGYPSQEHHAPLAYPSHSPSYTTHAHMPPPHPSNNPPPPGGYPHGSLQHAPLPPPRGSPPSHSLPSPPQGYPSRPDASHLPSATHLPPTHQSSYHPPPVQNPSQMSHLSQNVSGINSAMSNMSLGLGPASKVAQISLEFRALSLRDRDWIGKSDPVVNVHEPLHSSLDAAHVSEWKLLGTTETLRNNVNPTWAQRVKTRYYFERHQPLRVDIVDVDNFKTMKGDHLGTANTTLAEIVRNGSVRLKLKNKTGGAGRGELIIRAHDDDPLGKVRLKLSFSGKTLDKKDFMGKSDPYYKLMRVMPGSGGTSTLYKSEEKMNDLNPTWKPHTLMLSVGSTPWEQVSMVVEVYDWDRYTPHDLIGVSTFSLRQLTTAKMFPLVNQKKQAKKGSRYKNSGELVVHRADALELPGFISYLQGGLRLDFIVAVDFTASNRPADNPQSLHYMDDPNQPSQYYQALHATGTILADYLSDGYITALGFGAKLPGGGQEASFDFALNGQADARVCGVQGLLDAYKTALSNVSLAGPTYFTPIIKSAMGVANSVPVSQTNQHFAVLLILTDGIITDLSLTIETIIEASHSTPIAIVIVGIGKADFRAMQRLDADDHKLRNDVGDKVAKHDIVHFTKYDPTKPIEYLASDVLHEVPQRVVEFLADAGINPNPPVGQQPTY